MGIMLSVTLVKLLLVVYCRAFTNEIVKAYAQDHFFDVITNIIGLIAMLLAKYIDDWMDPVGAIIVSGVSFTILSFSLFMVWNCACINRRKLMLLLVMLTLFAIWFYNYIAYTLQNQS